LRAEVIWFATVVATIVALGFFWQGRARVRGHRDWIPADAVVVDHEGGEGIWLEIVEFTTADGRTVRTRDEIGTTWRRYRVGTHVTVHYDPAEPRRILLGPSMVRELRHVAIGLVVLAVAVVLAYRGLTT
jgi:hypothetical protein